MKPFDIELAKSGHPVCTRSGYEARIICFDRKGEVHTIVALVDNRLGGEDIWCYNIDGKYKSDTESDIDLFMASVKREGWINIYRKDGIYHLKEMFDTKENAIKYRDEDDYIATVKIEWEE